ncbi:hypothetical protein EDEG_02845 [Edhazardia aedis USNM 41457]|uniref:Uncharacterized protein n=1 Tax=Edhazardia aedis (strain USNM 41457) TaxID=1003232 RepID=J9DN08_EDHAE|nr:hypothetical protein EDEG_02845 [Edhazardia aedis USNM 41457]|eukprot:EJW02752.1 hypothetical protein EDEG_02845 [Edhazardia aedis USNM 41457]
MMQQPKYFILTQDSPVSVQQSNIQSILQLTTFLKTCLGPKSYQKMLLTKINTIELTNDGHNILRELDTSHCATKILVELSKTQEIVGDGTTSVVILAGELLQNLLGVLEDFHPTMINNFLQKIQKRILRLIESNSLEVDNKSFLDVVRFCLNSKVCKIMGIDVGEMAIRACEILKGLSNNNFSNSKNENSQNNSTDFSNIDNISNDMSVLKANVKDKLEASNLGLSLKENLKKHVLNAKEIKKQTKQIDPTYLKIEKFLGNINETHLMPGLIFNKTIYHAQMRTSITNPRVVLIQSTLEYKKIESQTSYYFTASGQFSEALLLEEQTIKQEIEKILKFKPDIVCCEKGINDFALSIFQSNNVTALRRFRKTEMERLSKVTGAKIVNSADMLSDKAIGTQSTKFEYKKFNEDYYCCFSGSNVCSFIIRGPSKDIMNEIERNFYDSFGVAKCLFNDNRVVVGGGSIEYFVAEKILNEAFSDLPNDKKLSLPASPVTPSSSPSSYLKSPEKFKQTFNDFVYEPRKTSEFRKKYNSEDLEKRIKEAVSNTFKTISILLCKNAGGNILKTQNELQTKFKEFEEKQISVFDAKKGKKSSENDLEGVFQYGVNGESGDVDVMTEIILEPIAVKTQCVKSMFDMVTMLLRVDGVIHGTKSDQIK